MKKKEDIRENILSLWKKSGKDRTVRIEGTSMKPFIIEGNSITFTSLSNVDDLKIGDIAVFQGESCLIAHRIVDRIRKEGKTWFKEKGDNLFYPAVIPGDVIVGKVVEIDKNGFKIDLTAYYWSFVNRFLGYYWRVLFTVLEFIVNKKKKFLNSKKNHVVSAAYKKISKLLIKLPINFFRSKQL